MHIIRFLPQENESQCASLVCTPDRQERQTTKLIENIKCSESVGPKHQSYVVNPQVFLGLAMSILALLTHRLSIWDPSRSQNSWMKGQQKQHTQQTPVTNRAAPIIMPMILNRPFTMLLGSAWEFSNFGN